MTLGLVPPPRFRATDNAGRPLAAGLLYTYQAGTNNPIQTYTDATQLVVNTNPIVLDGRGEANVWLIDGVLYKFTLTDAAGNTVWTVDNISSGQAAGGGVNFSPVPAADNTFNLGSPSLAWAQVYVGGVHAPIWNSTSNRLGYYPTTGAEGNAGIVPTDFTYPPGNVKRYGAKGDGVTDDTTAIQTAINGINNWSVYSTNIGNNFGATSDYNAGGTVFFPLGIYKVTQTIMLAPNVTLLGATDVGPLGGSNFTGITLDQTMPMIRAAFPGNVRQYVVDTANWRLVVEGTHTPVVPPYRVLDAQDQFFGVDKDNQIGTANPGCCIRNLRIDGNFTAFGGVRMQMWFYGTIDNVMIQQCNAVGMVINGTFESTLGSIAVSGCPMGVVVQGTESLMQSGPEMSIYCSIPAQNTWWTSANQSIINSVFYTPVAGSGILVNTATWYGLKMKALLVIWTINFTIGTFAANTADVGIEMFAARLNIGHWENEFTSGPALFLLRNFSICVVDGFSSKAAIPLCSGDPGSKLVIRQPFLLSATTTWTPFNGEATSTLEVQLVDPQIPDMILGPQQRLDNRNLTKIFNPIISGTPYSGAVTLYCSSSGSANLDGLVSSTPTTIDGALAFIANNPHILQWVIFLKDSQTHTIGSAHTLSRQSIQINRDFSGASAPILTVTAQFTLQDCSVRLDNLGLQSWSTTAAFFVVGTLQINIGSNGPFGSPAISIPTNAAIFSPLNSDTARVMMHGSFVFLTFASGSGLCTGATSGFLNYEDSLASASITGTAALEAITTGKVKKIASNIV